MRYDITAMWLGVGEWFPFVKWMPEWEWFPFVKWMPEWYKSGKESHLPIA